MSQALLWAIAGLVLVVAELLSTGFVLVFFGLGALVTALLVRLGLLSGLVGPIIVFSLASLALMGLMRSFLKRRFAGTKDMNPDYLGQTVLVVKDIGPGLEGAVSWRGSEWLAFSRAGPAFKAGERARVVGRDGIRLEVTTIETAQEALP